MQFLYRQYSKRYAVHLWDGRDTFCRMWSRRLLDHHRYELFDNIPKDGRSICGKCWNAAEDVISVNDGSVVFVKKK